MLAETNASTIQFNFRSHYSRHVEVRRNMIEHPIGHLKN